MRSIKDIWTKTIYQNGIKYVYYYKFDHIEQNSTKHIKSKTEKEWVKYRTKDRLVYYRTSDPATVSIYDPELRKIAKKRGRPKTK